MLTRGYQIAERNWRCRAGELDLVAMDGETLVFVEVRTRRPGRSFGTAEESVDWRKQRKVRSVADFYLHRQGLYNHQIRFDLITVQTDAEGRFVRLDHYRNAF